ncbi:hypothetical protein CEXT_785601 [Caerostris extrusa]|uniref:Uncharacterized protein n=1 Tax=Caerostris extrusa TaxID=172846 RepID=A0AAV4MKX9_CAEEX|nr:hypothetical protein CEXT_785601 [Caerostris extrusa]
MGYYKKKYFFSFQGDRVWGFLFYYSSHSLGILHRFRVVLCLLRNACIPFHRAITLYAWDVSIDMFTKSLGLRLLRSSLVVEEAVLSSS